MNKHKIRILILLIQTPHRNKPRTWNIIKSVDYFISILSLPNNCIHIK